MGGACAQASGLLYNLPWAYSPPRLSSGGERAPAFLPRDRHDTVRRCKRGAADPDLGLAPRVAILGFMPLECLAVGTPGRSAALPAPLSSGTGSSNMPIAIPLPCADACHVFLQKPVNRARFASTGTSLILKPSVCSPGMPLSRNLNVVAPIWFWSRAIWCIRYAKPIAVPRCADRRSAICR